MILSLKLFIWKCVCPTSSFGNHTHYHLKGIAHGLALKQRQKRTWKWTTKKTINKQNHSSQLNLWVITYKRNHNNNEHTFKVRRWSLKLVKILDPLLSKSLIPLSAFWREVLCCKAWSIMIDVSPLFWKW